MAPSSLHEIPRSTTLGVVLCLSGLHALLMTWVVPTWCNLLPSPSSDHTADVDTHISAQCCKNVYMVLRLLVEWMRTDCMIEYMPLSDRDKEKIKITKSDSYSEQKAAKWWLVGLLWRRSKLPSPGSSSEQRQCRIVVALTHTKQTTNTPKEVKWTVLVCILVLIPCIFN